MVAVSAAQPLERATGFEPTRDIDVTSASPTLADASDLAAVLSFLQLSSRSDGEQSAGNAAVILGEERRQKLREAQAALARALQAARDAQDDGGVLGTFSKVAMVAGAVAALASVVVTAGTSTPAIIALAGVALSYASPAIGDELGGTWGNIALYTGAGLSLAAGGWGAYDALASSAQAGASAASAATTGAATTSAATTGAATTSASAAGAATTSASVGAAATTQSTFVRVVGAVGRVATTAQGEAQIGVAIYTRRVGDDQGDQLEAQASETDSRAQATEAQHRLDDVANTLKVMEASVRRCVECALTMGHEVDQSLSDITKNIGRNA